MVRNHRSPSQDAPATLFDVLADTPPTPAVPVALHMRFDGADYEPMNDQARLSGQLLRVFDLMKDGRWRTLPEIATATTDPAASISAQLRHLRKERFGGHTVNKRHRGTVKAGLWEYQLLVRDQFVTRSA